MSEVISIRGVRPAARYDGVAWSYVMLQGADTEDGSYEDLLDDPVAISDPDIDPTDPAVRSFTFTVPEEPEWARVEFSDGVGGEQQTEAIPVGAEEDGYPSVQAVRENSPLLKQLYPFEPYDAEKEDEVTRIVNQARSIVESLTCRDLSVPLNDRRLEDLALRAVTMKSESLAVTSTSQFRSGAVGSYRLRSFTAGPYSETYFGPGEAATSKVLDPDPLANEVLWALCTECCREKWLELWTGEYAPAAMAVGFDYGARRRSIGGRRYLGPRGR